jgi:hypothetical protein
MRTAKKYNRFEKMLLKLPICMGWVTFKEKTVAMQINYEATVKAGKPMVDISYCMTTLLNGLIDQTVQWDKSKFKRSNLERPWKSN